MASGSAPLLGSENNDNAIRARLLVSHGITRMGTQGWLFCTPLFLLRYTPGSLLGPGLFGLATFGAGLFLGPKFGAWADVADRLTVVRTGVLLQALAVCGNAILILVTSSQDSKPTTDMSMWWAVILACCFGALEKLSFPLTDVPVKRDWVPTLLIHNKELLQRTNQRMSQIDLVTETVGPFVAGLLIHLPQIYDFTPVPSLLTPETCGFVLIGLLNAASCCPQYLLLRSVYRLQQDRLQRSGTQTAKAKTKMERGAWKAWLLHPFGVALLSSSYALLYFTVLSPHGGLLTAYLTQAGIPAPQLSLLRGAGALVGIMGVTARPSCFQCCGDRGANCISLGALAACILASAFSFREASQSSVLHAWWLYAFAGFVVLARPGLYAFELGVLNQQQLLVDEERRAAVGAVDDAMLSGMTLAIYLAGTVFNKPEQFGGLVNASAVSICMGFIVYGAWCLLYHEHKHQHGAVHGHDQGHDHGHAHHEHAHTTQEERSIDNEGWHSHVHFNPIWDRIW